ncbi:MAG: formylglycine-generating enzyme family protein [Chitinispirillaceae bacterium]|jgi:formylglycine-generating enzyme required for sulfatase activity
MKRIILLVVLVLYATLHTGCGKDSGTNAGGAHDTLYINNHDTLYISSHDTVIVRSYDTVIITSKDTITLYDTVTIHTYDTVRIYCTDTTGYTLTPTATTGGTISPSVPVKVSAGNFQVFFAKPNIYYILDSVTADSVRLQVSAGPMGYTVYMLNVSKDMTIKAWFSLRQIHYGMKLIPVGTFLMGVDSIYQTAGIVNTFGDTIHQVTLSAFYLDTTEVTQEEYLSLMGVNPSYFRDSTNGASYPVEQVTWFDAVLYCNARSKSEGKDTIYSFSHITGEPGNGCQGLLDLAIDYMKNGYRLPTEAEWEYACRGGTTTNYWWGNDTNGMGDRAWTFYNSGNTTHIVATKVANAYGLYDMTGNVWELCNDWYGSYPSGAITNPTGAATGTHRVLRGGSWNYTFGYLRSAYRNNLYPDARYYYNGFRCVRR